MSKGSDRNKPCPCGSDQKFKRCCYGRKPVTETITLDYGEPVQVNGYTFKNGRIELLKDGVPLKPKVAWMGSHREGNKGEKTLLRVPIDTNSLYFGEAQALLRYNRLLPLIRAPKL